MSTTTQRTARTAAATAAASAVRTARRLDRMAAELAAAGYHVTDPSGSAVGSHSVHAGRQELARELLQRFPADYVLGVTGMVIKNAQQHGDEFSWEDVLYRVLDSMTRDTPPIWAA